MDERQSNLQTRPQEVEKKDQQAIGHGDKLEHAVEKVTKNGSGAQSDPEKTVEIME